MKSWKYIAATLCGAVLFFVLGRYVSIPSPIDTVNICVQYGLLWALWLWFSALWWAPWRACWAISSLT